MRKTCFVILAYQVYAPGRLLPLEAFYFCAILIRKYFDRKVAQRSCAIFGLSFIQDMFLRISCAPRPMYLQTKRKKDTDSWWLTPVIPATQETEIRRIVVQSQPRKIVHEILS
jgi:hypothetical protein